MVLLKHKLLLPLLLLFETQHLYCSFNEPTSKGLFGFLLNSCKCKCGVPNRDSRLLAGEYLKEHEFPWLTIIHVKDKLAVPGTLINDRHILTSATPIAGLTPYDVKVTLGQYNRCFPDVSSINISVESITVHPDYDILNRVHDIALLKLNSPVKFGRNVSPVCLSTPGSTYLGQVATLVGWSDMAEVDGINFSCRPRKLGLPVLDREGCLGSVLDASFFSNDKGCAGVVGAPGVICKSDVGGSVLYRSHGGVYEIIGILSDKNECSNQPSSATFTNINDHLPWIVQNTKQSCYCLKI